MNRKEKKKMFRCGACVAAFVIVLALFFFGMHCWENNRQVPENAGDGKVVSYKGVRYVPKSNIESFLVIGLDKFLDEDSEGSKANNKQSDFIMLVVVDNHKQTYSALHLNRDTMIEIDVMGKNSVKVGEVYQQLAFAHTYGTEEKDSCNYTKRAVSKLLNNVRIDHYASMTLDAVSKINDLMDGVEVVIMDDFTDVDPDMTEGKTMTLNGDQALLYVRARGELDDKTNLNRMKRQRQYVTAANEKAHEKIENDADFITNAVVKVFPYVTSDITSSQVSRMLEKIKDYTFNGFSTIEGEMTEGEKYLEYNLDEDSVMQNVLDLFYEPAEE